MHANGLVENRHVLSVLIGRLSNAIAALIQSARLLRVECETSTSYPGNEITRAGKTCSISDPVDIRSLCPRDVIVKVTRESQLCQLRDPIR